MKVSKQKIVRMIFCIILILVPVCIIFYFSSQPGVQSYGISNRVSAYIARKWNQIFHLNFSDSSMNVLITSLYMPTRKLAHITEYAVLGTFAYCSMYLHQRNVKLSGIFTILLFVFIIASCDEIHQYFVLQRGSHITDTCLDFVSGTAGIYLFIILKDFVKKIKYIINRTKRRTVLD